MVIYIDSDMIQLPVAYTALFIFSRLHSVSICCLHHAVKKHLLNLRTILDILSNLKRVAS